MKEEESNFLSSGTLTFPKFDKNGLVINLVTCLEKKPIYKLLY